MEKSSPKQPREPIAEKVKTKEKHLLPLCCFSVLLPCSVSVCVSLSVFISLLPAPSLVTRQHLVMSTVNCDTKTRSPPASRSASRLPQNH